MEYDPRSRSSRKHLASIILLTLADAGFMEEWHGDAGDPTREKVFYRPLDGVPSVRVLVYTSIVDGPEGPEVREVGKDACRVVALYKSDVDGQERGIVKATRVHRTGDTEAIAKRLLERMRTVYGKALRPTRCPKCGAPMFKSKKGNDVCADICWKRGDTRPQRRDDYDDYDRDYRYASRSYRRRRW